MVCTTTTSTDRIEYSGPEVRVGKAALVTRL